MGSQVWKVVLARQRAPCLAYPGVNEQLLEFGNNGAFNLDVGISPAIRTILLLCEFRSGSGA